MYIVTLTYIFKVTKFLKVIFNSWKMVRASKKYSSTTFIEVDTSHWMALLRMLFIVTLTYVFKVKLFKWLLWQASASTKMLLMTFMQIDICYQTVSSVFWPRDLNPLTAAIRGSGYKFFVTLHHEPAVRIEHYLQIRTGGPDRTIPANWDREPAARMYT